jgi:hypothetical protein
MQLDSFTKNLKRLLEHAKLSFENFVKWFFRALNLRADLNVSFRKIRDETAEHVNFMGSALKKIVLPLSVCYLLSGFFLGNNVVDSLFLSILVFVYSNFLPDLLSPFRFRGKKEESKDEIWFKKYGLLFLAPIFIFLLWGDGIPVFRTTEHFHNVKSLGAHSLFLFLLGLVFYGNMPFSLGRILEVLSLTMFGSIGYALHLKADGIL